MFFEESDNIISIMSNFSQLVAPPLTLARSRLSTRSQCLKIRKTKLTFYKIRRCP